MNEPLGSGRRFRALESKLSAKKGVKNPAALAASIGRKKFGNKRMGQLSARGRERAEAERETRAAAARFPALAEKPMRRVKV
jgi:hypothetical protein